MTATPTSIHSAPKTRAKYWTAYKASLSTFLQYRLNLALYSIGHVISITALYFLWTAIYEAGHTIGNYTFQEILAYYILIALLRLTINEGTGMAFQTTNEIKEGTITPYLTRPFSYPLRQFVDVLAKTTLNIAIVVPIVVMASMFLGLGEYLPHGIAIVYGVAWGLLALLLYIVIYFLVAVLSFWLDRVESYIYAVIVLSNFFNGSLIPLDVFPPWFVTISNWLPFKYLMFVPIQAFLGRQTFSGIDMVIGLSWLIVLSGLIAILWQKGLKQYESQGI